MRRRTNHFRGVPLRYFSYLFICIVCLNHNDLGVLLYRLCHILAVRVAHELRRMSVANHIYYDARWVLALAHGGLTLVVDQQ